MAPERGEVEEGWPYGVAVLTFYGIPDRNTVKPQYRNTEREARKYRNTKRAAL